MSSGSSKGDAMVLRTLLLLACAACAAAFNAAAMPALRPQISSPAISVRSAAQSATSAGQTLAALLPCRLAFQPPPCPLNPHEPTTTQGARPRHHPLAHRPLPFAFGL